MNTYRIGYRVVDEKGRPERAVRIDAFSADDALTQFNVWSSDRWVRPVYVSEIRPVSREVSWEEVSGGTPAYVMCSCGATIQAREDLRRHWQDGHFRMSAPQIGLIVEE